MSALNDEVLQAVSGWPAVELIMKCIFFGIWEILRITVKKLWKGHRRKSSKNFPPVELSVDSSIGTHCYIKVMGVKYHYVETGPKSGQLVLILGDAPGNGDLWCPNWANVVRVLAETGHHIITLDLRGTGGSEGGSRSDLSPPKAVKELSTLMEALGVSENNPAIVIGFGIGGMLTWYLVHCYEPLICKFVVIGAPHPNLYWQYPPASFCKRALHFIQWPYFPEQWLAEEETSEGDGQWSSSRACDWTGALNYVRGAAWWRVGEGRRVATPALVVGGAGAGAGAGAAALVGSAAHCAAAVLRLAPRAGPADPTLSKLLLDHLLPKKKVPEEVPRTLMGRMLGAVAGRGRELTARLVLPPAQA